LFINNLHKQSQNMKKNFAKKEKKNLSH